MLEKNKIQGYSRRHTISVYDQTWKDFQNIKNKEQLSTDALLKQFMKQRKILNELQQQNGLSDMEKNLISSKAIIQTDIKSLNRHHKELNDNLKNRLNDITLFLNSLK